jgi:transcription elongation factor GreB
MSRYRPPSKPSAKYITPTGYRNLKRELHQLWKVERPAVTQSVSEAAAQGDRSENAEYIYGKKRLREIDGRVRFIIKRLEGMTVVSEPPPDEGRIYFAAFVTLEIQEHKAIKSITYRIVGPDELEPKLHYISVDSTLSQSLLGKTLGDSITINSQAGDRTYTVIAIRYERTKIRIS